MKFNNKKIEWKKPNDLEETSSEAIRKRKKERREKHKPKNQKLHQFEYDEEDEYGGMF